jgi:hypothetical protein
VPDPPDAQGPAALNGDIVKPYEWNPHRLDANAFIRALFSELKKRKVVTVTDLRWMMVSAPITLIPISR